jgi:hypothetical protein
MTRLLVLLLLIAMALPAAAAASGSAVIRDCTDDGRLSKRYSQKDLRDALSSMPSDVDEYTNCRDVIRRAAFGGAGASGGGKGGGSSSGGGSAGGEFGGFGDQGSSSAGSDPLSGASDDERAALDKARREGGDSVKLTEEDIAPGSIGRRAQAAGGSDVPAPLIIAAIVLALAAAAVGAPTIRNRVFPGRRNGS